MNLPPVNDLLTLWEHGRDLSLLRKTLLLLELSFPEFDSNEVAELSIGERDIKLLELRESMFGPVLMNRIDCPECRQSMEWEMKTEDLIPADYKPVNGQVFELHSGNYKINFRLPNSRDVMEVLSENIPDAGSLAKRCILEIRQKGNKKLKKVPDNVIGQLNDKMEELDPAADIRMSVSCPECSCNWQARFDIMSYLWFEIDNWAIRLFRDVYTLASAFGWSEQDILSMNAGRRQLYVEMING